MKKKGYFEGGAHCTVATTAAATAHVNH